MDEHRFAELWPIAEAHGWTLEQVGYGYYVTPPPEGPEGEDDGRFRVNNWHNYINYQDKLVFVHHLFEREVESIQNRDTVVRFLPSAATQSAPAPSSEPARASSATAEGEEKLTATTPGTEETITETASVTQKKRKGWGRWLKSFIWRQS